MFASITYLMASLMNSDECKLGSGPLGDVASSLVINNICLPLSIMNLPQTEGITTNDALDMIAR